MLYIPPEIEYIITVLKKKGYDAYLVGGCVRDMLNGAPPHDYDITTAAPPEVTSAAFKRTIPTGIKHGTVTVLNRGFQVEVTTYRADGEYLDCRRPESVTFVQSLKEDLARRDFTVNAMAYNSRDGLIDFFGGQADIKSRTLRAVGEAEQRFCEDALRIMRLFRFSSVLEFEIEEKTLAAAVKCAPLLEKISAERIMSELKKTLCGKNPAAIKPLCDCGGLEFAGVKKAPDLVRLKKLSADSELSLFAFFHFSGADAVYSVSLLKAPNSLKYLCRDMLCLLKLPFPETKPEIKEMLNMTAFLTVERYLLLNEVFFETDVSKARLMLCEITENGEPYRIKDLAIGGKELAQAGISGEAAGRTLEALRRLVTNSPRLNSKDTLLEKAKQLNRN